MKIQEIFENRAGQLPNKIKPLKMPTPPKAPDATTPVGTTTDMGVSYKQDKYNPKHITVSSGAGSYTFDGQRLIRWVSPMPKYRQIHDFVQQTITVLANTTVQSSQGADVLVNQKAVYDMQGNIKQGTQSMGMSAGGLGVQVNDKDGFNMSYFINDTLQFRLKQNNLKAKNVNPNVIKQAVDMMQQGDINSTARGFNLLNKIGDLKWLVNGKATHPTEVFTMIKNGKI
jgi:hypothetical protein